MVTEIGRCRAAPAGEAFVDWAEVVVAAAKHLQQGVELLWEEAHR